MKKVLISGYYGFCNTGDEAMIETMARLLSKRNYELIVLSSNPEKTKERYHVQAYDRNSLGKIMKALKEADLVISGGGTLFQDITSRKSLLYYLGIVRLAQWLHKKIVVAYQGMGPLEGSLGRTLTRHVLNKNRVKLIALRDEQAIDFAKEIGIDSKKISFSSDMIFMLEPVLKERAKQLLNSQLTNYQEGQKIIGISVREWMGKDRTDLFAQLADQLVEKFKAYVVFFPFHQPKDAELSKIIIGKMKHSSQAVIMADGFLPSEILGMMGLMDLNIGVRLHSLIFSAVMNVPTIGISYDPKIDGFLQTIGMEPVGTYDKLDVEKVIRGVENTMEERPDYRQYIASFKEKGMETLDRILEELEE